MIRPMVILDYKLRDKLIHETLPTIQKAKQRALGYMNAHNGFKFLRIRDKEKKKVLVTSEEFYDLG